MESWNYEGYGAQGLGVRGGREAETALVAVVGVDASVDPRGSREPESFGADHLSAAKRSRRGTSEAEGVRSEEKPRCRAGVGADASVGPHRRALSA